MAASPVAARVGGNIEIPVSSRLGLDQLGRGVSVNSDGSGSVKATTAFASTPSTIRAASRTIRQSIRTCTTNSQVRETLAISVEASVGWGMYPISQFVKLYRLSLQHDTCHSMIMSWMT
jgi:hypothetical protein